jgi:hypothetical protein
MKPKTVEKNPSVLKTISASKTGAGPRLYAGWVFADEDCRDGSSIVQLGNVSLDPSFIPDDLIFE